MRIVYFDSVSFSTDQVLGCQTSVVEFFLAFEVLAFCLGGQCNFGVTATISAVRLDGTKIDITNRQIRSGSWVFSNYSFDKLLIEGFSHLFYLVSGRGGLHKKASLYIS